MKPGSILPLICALAIACTQLSCGLEMPLVAFFAPEFVEASGNLFTFRTQTDHVDDASRLFHGYEIYYRISSTGSFSPISTLEDYSALSPNGFRRLYLSTDTWDPVSVEEVLVATDAPWEGTQYDITIDFSSLAINSDGEPVVSSPGGEILTVTIRRNIQESTSGNPEYNHYKRFAECWNGDADIPAIVFDTLDPVANKGDSILVYIELYVFAYGSSRSSSSFFTPIRSPLAYLTSNQISVYYDNGII